MTFRSRIALTLCLTFLGAGAPLAGEADVVAAIATLTGENTYRFDVSVSHADIGWEHYANAFEIFDLEDNLLGTRVLMHPHVGERPFTRSLSIVIPEGVTSVRIRALDSKHETGGKDLVLELPGE